MKVMRSILVSVSAAVLLVAVIGCASASSLANKKDKVSAIKQLAKNLVKDSSDQEMADVFNEVYNSEMSSKMYIVQATTNDVLNDFMVANGASSVEAALSSIANGIPDRDSKTNTQTVLSEISVKEAVNRLTELKNTYRDLTEIQSAVKPMPSTIGSIQTYDVQKYNDNFNGEWTKAADALGDFYVKCGDAMMPAKTPYEISNIIGVYQKAEQEYLTQSKVSSVRNTIYNLYMNKGNAFITLVKKDIPEIPNKDSAINIRNFASSVIEEARQATDAFTQALSYKSFDSKAMEAQKEAYYYSGLAYLTGAQNLPSKGFAETGTWPVYAEGQFGYGNTLDYKDARDKQKDARALAVKYGRGDGVGYYCCQLDYDLPTKHITITYNRDGKEQTVNGEDFYSMDKLDQSSYGGMGADAFILWGNDFDYRVNGKSQLWSTGLRGETVTYNYKKDADGTIRAYNSYGKEIYTFTTTDNGETYVYKSDIKMDYTFKKY